MRLVVGLGNPGKEYDNTRHNVGFSILDSYLSKESLQWKTKFQGLYYEKVIDGEKVIFLKPQTYMNLSGTSVLQFVKYYKIRKEDILVICDDLDQKIGKYRLRSHGSCGGHNGLRNIETCLGTNEYKRLKIGISSDKKGQQDTVSFVLGYFTKEEDEILSSCAFLFRQIIDEYFKMDFDSLMNKYNHRK